MDRKISVVIHVVHGEEGFDRAIRCTPQKLARIQAHEFNRIERAGSGFLRVEMPGKFTHRAEIHYEFIPRASRSAGKSARAKRRAPQDDGLVPWMRGHWSTLTRGEPAVYRDGIEDRTGPHRERRAS